MKLLLCISLALCLPVRAQTAAQVVAAVICAESRGEGPAGMQAVYEVIWTRAKEHRLSLEDEVRHPKWYSCLNGTTPTRLVQRMSKTGQWEFALKLVAGGLPKTSFSKGANHFTLATERPSWARGQRPVVLLGKHAFYKLSPGS